MRTVYVERHGDDGVLDYDFSYGVMKYMVVQSHHASHIIHLVDILAGQPLQLFILNKPNNNEKFVFVFSVKDP